MYAPRVEFHRLHGRLPIAVLRGMLACLSALHQEWMLLLLAPLYRFQQFLGRVDEPLFQRQYEWSLALFLTATSVPAPRQELPWLV